MTINDLNLTMPAEEVLYAIASRLDRQAREQSFTAGSNYASEKLEHMRNRVLIANTEAEGAREQARERKAGNENRSH